MLIRVIDRSSYAGLSGRHRRWWQLFPVLLAALTTVAPAFAQSSLDGDTVPGQWEYEHADYGRAALKFQSTVDEMERTGVRDLSYSHALSRLGTALYMGKRFDESIDVYRKLTAQDESLYGTNSVQVAEDIYNQMRSVRRMGHFSEAQPLMERTLSIRRNVLGEDHKLVGNSWLDIALNCQRLGRFAESEEAFIKGIAQREKLEDPSHTLLPGALRQYADLLRQLGRYPEAEAALARATQIQSRN